jgi:hypothetical protein
MAQDWPKRRALLAVGGPKHRRWVIGDGAGELRIALVAKWGGRIGVTTFGEHLYRERIYEEPGRDPVFYWASAYLTEQAAQLLFIRSDGPAMSRVMQAHP